MRKKTILWLALTLALTPMLSAGEVQTRDLHLNWKFLLGNGTYSLYGQKPSVPSTGLLMEIYPATQVRTMPGLDYGVATQFFVLAGYTPFDIVNPLSSETERWEVSTFTLGSALMAKAGYSMNLGALRLGLHQGVGLVYSLVQEDHRRIDSPNIIVKGSNRDQIWSAAAEVNLSGTYQLNDNNYLGLSLGATYANWQTGPYQALVNFSLGLAYEVMF